MKHATFDSEGFPLGFYSEDVHGASIPTDAVPITDAQWGEFISHQGRRRWENGDVVSYDPPPPPTTVDDYRRAIQQHVDATARQRNYDSGVTCSSYVNSTIPTWAAQATAFVAWRDAVWAYAFTELAKVEGGQRPQPTVAEIVGELPAMAWPA